MWCIALATLVASTFASLGSGKDVPRRFPQDEKFNARYSRQDEQFDAWYSPQDEQFDVGESPRDEQFAQHDLDDTSEFLQRGKADSWESPRVERVFLQELESGGAQFQQRDDLEDVKVDSKESPADEVYKRGVSGKNIDLTGVRDWVIHELKPKTIELLVAFDYSIIKFYGRDFLSKYVAVMESAMCDIFQSPSLQYPMKVVVVRAVYFDTDIFQAESLTDLLSNFTAWFEKPGNNPAGDENERHADIGMILTRKGYSEKKGAKKGLANSGMCQRRAACVVDDYGMMSVITAVHEIAHTMGIPHDDDTPCRNESTIYFMAENKLPNTPMRWSKCTSNTLHTLLQSNESVCFDDVRTNKPLTGVTVASKTPYYGTVYGRDQQCKFMYNNRYHGCHNPAVKSSCSILWCSLGHNCVSESVPPIDGTSCGPREWCVDSQCVAAGDYLIPVNGGWSAWSGYVTCRAECGLGEHWKERTCTHPRPANGGKDCIGLTRKDHKTCNSGVDCGSTKHKTRLALCRERSPSRNFLKIMWSGDRCRLQCLNVVKVGRRWRWAKWEEGTVPDGFRCYPWNDLTKKDLCIAGKCKLVACDHELDSDAVLDRCGKCNGDGSACSLQNGAKTQEQMQQSISQEFTFVTTIPAGASRITVKETKPTSFGFFVFKLGNMTSPPPPVPSTRGEYGDRDIYLGITKVKSWRYYKRNFADKMYIEEETQQPISIWYYSAHTAGAGRTDVSFSKGIEWDYAFKPSDNLVSTFNWKALEWSACSQTCGGGNKTRKVVCVRQDDKSAVGKQACGSITQPDVKTECNVNIQCKPQWEVTWNVCTKTCGSGISTRQLKCKVMRAGRETGVERSECGALPAGSQTKACNQVMCAAQWNIITQFGKCEGKCGGSGVKSREVLCQHIKGNGDKVKTAPQECKGKKKPDDIQSCTMPTC